MLTSVVATALLLASVGTGQEHTVLNDLRFTSDGMLDMQNEMTDAYDQLCFTFSRRKQDEAPCSWLEEERKEVLFAVANIDDAIQAIHDAIDANHPATHSINDHKRRILLQLTQNEQTGELCLIEKEHGYTAWPSFTNLLFPHASATVACSHTAYDDQADITTFVSIPGQILYQQRRYQQQAIQRQLKIMHENMAKIQHIQRRFKGRYPHFGR